MPAQAPWWWCLEIWGWLSRKRRCWVVKNPGSSHAGAMTSVLGGAILVRALTAVEGRGGLWWRAVPALWCARISGGQCFRRRQQAVRGLWRALRVWARRQPEHCSLAP